MTNDNGSEYHIPKWAWALIAGFGSLCVVMISGYLWWLGTMTVEQTATLAGVMQAIRNVEAALDRRPTEIYEHNVRLTTLERDAENRERQLDELERRVDQLESHKTGCE